MDQPERLDYFNPAFIMALIMAFMSDLAGLALLPGVLLPFIGIMFGAAFGAIHYPVGIIILFIVLPHLRHFIPKALVILAVILPLPLMGITILIALVLQNKLIEFIAVETALFVTEVLLKPVDIVAPEIGIPGEIIAGSAEVAEGAKAVNDTKNVAKGIGKAAKGASNVRKGVGKARDYIDEQDEQEDANRNEVSPEELGEEPFFFDKLEEEDFATPTEQPSNVLAFKPRAPKSKDDENVTIQDDGTVDLAEHDKAA